MTKKMKIMISRIVLGLILFIASLLVKNYYAELSLVIIGYTLVAYDILFKAIRNIIHREIFDENLLMLIATIGAFITNNLEEALAVVILYQIGELFQSYAVRKSRRSIKELVKMQPNTAWILENDELKEIDARNVKIDDIIVVKPGERIPLDGIIVDGNTTMDLSMLTGESMPLFKNIDDEVYSGTINLANVIKIKVTKLYKDSTASKILEMVEQASSRKAKTERFITKFAKYYTPTVLVLALLLAIIPPLVIDGATFTDYVYRACSFLVISCPCALVISVPLSFFSGIGCASKNGILIKGSNYLEQLAKTKVVVTDKTGTLTKGNFIVTKIETFKTSKEEIIECASYAEYYSNHLIARAVKELYKGEFDLSRIKDIKEIAGCGVIATLDRDSIIVGNKKLLLDNSINVMDNSELVGTVIYVAKNNELLGYILIEDEIKNESYQLVNELKKNNVDVAILTGDNKLVAEKVGNALGISKIYSNLSPKDKLDRLENIIVNKQTNTTVVYAGDGINDAPVITRADVGIAMGAAGSDAAIEAADVVIMDDNINKITTTVKIAKKTKMIAMENIIFAIGIKVIVLILAALNIASMWLAIFADVGVAVIAILNAMRALRIK